MIDQAVAELTPLVGVRAGCAAVGETQARWYRRHRQSPPPKRERSPAAQPRALSEVERKELRRVLNSPEHVDEAPATVYAKLLDEGVYLASVPTTYRVLRDHDEVHERRRQATHPGGQEARAAGRQAQRGLLVGRHQAARPGQVDLVLPVRDPRHLLAVCARLDAGACRERPPG
jgi:hypothetical protein